MDIELLERKGEGNVKPTPILLVHGAWHGAWCWKDNFLEYFAGNGYNTYAVSFRGHGESQSEKSIKVTRIKDYVKDLDATIRKLPALPYLIGHSMGGMVVLKYLEEQDCPGAVLLAPVPTHGVWQTVFRILWRHPLRFLLANIIWSLYPLVSKPKLVREQFFSPDTPRDFVDQWTSKLGDESYLGFLDMLLLNLVDAKLVRGKKLLVLGGDADRLFSTAEIKKTAKALGTVAEIFPGMPHGLIAAAGWENVVARIDEWLESIQT